MYTPSNLTHAYRGSDWQEVDLGKKLGKQDIQIGDYTIKGVTADAQKIHGMKVYKNLAMNTFQLGRMAKILAAQGREEDAAKVWELVSKMVNSNTHSAMGELVVDEKGNVAKFVMGNDVIVGKKSEFSATDKAKEEVDIAPYQSTPQTARAFMEGYSSAADAYTRRQVEEHGDAALRYQAVMATKAVEDFFRQSGMITTASRASGGGQIKFSPTSSLTAGLAKLVFGVDASASGGVNLSRENLEKIQHDLVYWKIRQIQNEAVKAAMVGGKIDWGIFREMYQEKMEKFWQGVNAVAEGKDPSQFGASSIVGEPAALFKKYLSEVKGNIVEAFQKWQKHMDSERQEFYQAIANNDVEAVQKEYPSLTRSQAERYIALMQQRMKEGKPLVLSPIEVYRLVNSE